MMNRTIRTKVPVFIPSPTGKAHKEARQADKKQKEKHKNYTDKHRRARDVEHKVEDKVLLRQTKTTVNPPYDPETYVVEQVRGAEKTARRGKSRVTRNVKKWKGIKERPKYLQQQSRETGIQEDSDEEEEDWYFELPAQPPAQQEQEEQAGAGGHQPQQRQIPQ